MIPASEVKNRQELVCELPPETAALLERYLGRFHPLLAGAPSPWLFPSADAGRHKCPEQLASQIKRTVFRRTGLIVNVHPFRHIAAKLYLDEHPGGYEVARRLLGHQRMDTTINHYTGLETAAAARHFDATILGLRRRQCGGLGRDGN